MQMRHKFLLKIDTIHIILTKFGPFQIILFCVKKVSQSAIIFRTTLLDPITNKKRFAWIISRFSALMSFHLKAQKPLGEISLLEQISSVHFTLWGKIDAPKREIGIVRFYTIEK